MGKRNHESGYILVAVAAVLVVLLGFTALAIDFGMLNSQRSNAQRAADAAALAGAFTFVVDPTSPQPATATNEAMSTATHNAITGNSIQSSEVTINVDTANQIVTVHVARIEPTVFGRVLGRTSEQVAVVASAQASPNAVSSYCVKPWFIPNTLLTTQSTPCDACTTGQTLVAQGGDGTWHMTPFGQSKLGTQFQITPQNPSGSIAPGQFYAIQLPDSQGGNDYRTNIATCSPLTVVCSNSYSVETGRLVGPTNQGVQGLIGSPADTWVGISQYQHSDGTTSDTSRSLVSAPIWDACNMSGFCPNNNFPSGTNVALSVVGFAVIFVDGVSQGNATGHLVNITGCGNAPSPNPIGSAPFSIPITLIQPPQ